jgi:hypothetical protein
MLSPAVIGQVPKDKGRQQFPLSSAQEKYLHSAPPSTLDVPGASRKLRSYNPDKTIFQYPEGFSTRHCLGNYPLGIHFTFDLCSWLEGEKLMFTTLK